MCRSAQETRAPSSKQQQQGDIRARRAVQRAMRAQRVTEPPKEQTGAGRSPASLPSEWQGSEEGFEMGITCRSLAESACRSALARRAVAKSGCHSHGASSAAALARRHEMLKTGRMCKAPALTRCVIKKRRR